MSLLRRQHQGGNTIVEFALVSVFLVPLLFGSFSLGMSLSRTVQAGVVARDAGAMFMRYVDFTLTANKNVLVRLANGMGMTATGGNGVVILTQVLKIGETECAMDGLSPGSCPNYNRPVVIKRVSVGNTALYTSTYGNPSSSLVQADGTIHVQDYLRESSCRADNFANLMTLNSGEFAYISEAYFRTPEIDLPGYRNNTHVYSRNIF